MTGERWEGKSILNAGLLRCHWPKQVTHFKAVECAILGKPKGDTLSPAIQPHPKRETSLLTAKPEVKTSPPLEAT